MMCFNRNASCRSLLRKVVVRDEYLGTLDTWPEVVVETAGRERKSQLLDKELAVCEVRTPACPGGKVGRWGPDVEVGHQGPHVRFSFPFEFAHPSALPPASIAPRFAVWSDLASPARSGPGSWVGCPFLLPVSSFHYLGHR